MSEVHRCVRLAALAAVGATLICGRARADNKYLETPPPSEARTSRACRYANLSNQAARAELDARTIPYEQATPPLPGVRLPIVLRGPLRGVTIRSTLPAEQRENSPFEILDARLALALDDFCRILAQHDIVELVHFTIYRPPTKTPKNPGQPQTRHPGGLAIDLGGLRKRDGQWLAVGPHWPALLGAKTCGPGARQLKQRQGRELVSIVCEAYDQRIFHYTLTPHFDRPHADHLHLEIKPKVEWFLIN